MGYACLYFVLVTVSTAPVWLLGYVIHFQVLPELPISSVAVICPALAAGIAAYRSGGCTALRRILARGIDGSKAGWRLVLVVLINPILFALAFLLSRLLGSHIPDPRFAPMHALALTVLFLPSAFLEEIGWTGYALDRLQQSYGWLKASLALGFFWSFWHYPALFQVERPMYWIAWWSLWSVSQRVIMVWLYNRTNASVFTAVLYHAASNLCWQLYPLDGSYFDPRISGVITFSLALALTAWTFMARHDRTG